MVFDVEPSEVDESLVGDPEPEAAARELAERKALAIADRHRGERVWVIGSDTVVAVGEGRALRLLGKPRDATEAGLMLRALSMTRHRVVTGVAVVDCAKAGEAGCRSAWERTWVHMRRITPEEVEAYVRSDEWRGKAGGYAIQENADAFVERLEEGGFDNVVGLPVELTLKLLTDSGAFQPS